MLSQFSQIRKVVFLIRLDCPGWVFLFTGKDNNFHKTTFYSSSDFACFSLVLKKCFCRNLLASYFTYFIWETFDEYIWMVRTKLFSSCTILILDTSCLWYMVCWKKACSTHQVFLLSNFFLKLVMNSERRWCKFVQCCLSINKVIDEIVKPCVSFALMAASFAFENRLALAIIANRYTLFSKVR